MFGTRYLLRGCSAGCFYVSNSASPVGSRIIQGIQVEFFPPAPFVRRASRPRRLRDSQANNLCICTRKGEGGVCSSHSTRTTSKATAQKAEDEMRDSLSHSTRTTSKATARKAGDASAGNERQWLFLLFVAGQPKYLGRRTARLRLQFTLQSDTCSTRRVLRSALSVSWATSEIR
jgi:hypothetical protein